VKEIEYYQKSIITKLIINKIWNLKY
jgi:hypothetical protein